MSRPTTRSQSSTAGPASASADAAHSTPAEAVREAFRDLRVDDASGTDLASPQSISVPMVDTNDISNPHNGRPNTNIEALYTHVVPMFESENVGRHLSQPPRHISASNFPRVSLQPGLPSGGSTSSTNKTALLRLIMINDPDLRKDGIQVTQQEDLHLCLDDSLRGKLREHRDTRFLSQWNRTLSSEQDILQSEVFTDETTTTGVFRAFLYRLCNLFAGSSENFIDPILCSIWGDPPTVTVSNMDVGCWQDLRCIHGGEHKRCKVCTNEHLQSLSTAAATLLPTRKKGIHISLRDDDTLHFEGLESYDVKIGYLLAQVCHVFPNRYPQSCG